MDKLPNIPKEPEKVHAKDFSHRNQTNTQHLDQLRKLHGFLPNTDRLQQGSSKTQTWEIPPEIEKDRQFVHAQISITEQFVHAQISITECGNQFLEMVNKVEEKLKLSGALVGEFQEPCKKTVASLSEKFHTTLKRASEALEVIDTDQRQELVKKEKAELKEMLKQMLDLNKDLDTFNELGEMQREVNEFSAHSSKEMLDIKKSIHKAIKDYSQALDSYNLEGARKNLEDTYADVMDKLQSMKLSKDINDVKNKISLIWQETETMESKMNEFFDQDIYGGCPLNVHSGAYERAMELFGKDSIKEYENMDDEDKEKYLERNERLDTIEKNIEQYKIENKDNDMQIKELKAEMYSIQMDLSRASLEDMRLAYYPEICRAARNLPDLLKELTNKSNELFEQGQAYKERTAAQISQVEKQINQLTTLPEKERLQRQVSDLTNELDQLKTESQKIIGWVAGFKEPLKEDYTGMDKKAEELKEELERLIPDSHHPYFSFFQRTEDLREIDQSLPGSCAIVATRWILKEQGKDIQGDATEKEIAELMGYPEQGWLKDKAIETFKNYDLHAEWIDIESFDHLKQLRDERKSIYVVIGKEHVKGHAIAIDKVWKEEPDGKKLLTFAEGKVRSGSFDEERTGQITYEELRKYLYPKYYENCVLVAGPRV